MNNFSNILITWYLQNKRDLPWRNTTDPYAIWLSEIILQQTRVSQGLPYYLRFIEQFPRVEDLAAADIDTVLKLWQGLGYYSRARNLHHTAKYISDECNGQFPTHVNGLLKLKGVGDYTASAIASICYKEPTAVVDGNVYRVLARYFGIDTPINSTQGIKDFKALAQSLIDTKQPDVFNQAIMEFGANACTPKSPNCTQCPLQHSCAALQQKNIDTLPVKINKTKIRQRHFNYLVFHNDEDQLLLPQRTKKGIWQGLYEFPLVETAKEAKKTTVQDAGVIDQLVGQNIKALRLFNPTPIKHQLSHQTIFAKFWIIETTTAFKNGIPWEDIENFPVPILIHNFIKKYKLQA